VSKTTLEEKKAGLKEKGILLTIQRSAILEFLQDNTHHPTADEIYQSLRRIYPALSRATVYNTLDLFKQHGLVQEVTIERTKAHYDYNTEPHHHFFCRQCGGIYDVGLEGVPLEPGGWLNGHKMEEARLYMTGTCAVCLGKERDAGAP
jgi:Fur family peroxide stress response transcriptional regulator